MYQPTKINRRVAYSRLTLAVLAALAAAPALAQDTKPAPDKKVSEIGTLVVTGTHKAGLSPTESISPIDVYSGAQLEQQATSDLTDSLTKIMPALNTQRFPIADGTAFVRPVSLRNLAPDQTLVLVNGVRRHRSALVNLQLAPLGTVNQGAQAVDFSAIPSNAIQRVEVLRDGAAVLYGSDAIAGVVNVILNDSSEGANVTVQYGEYGEGDGKRDKIGASAGFHLGQDGFIHVSAERDTSNITSRGNPRPDAAAIAGIVGADKVPYNGFGQRWGDPNIDANKLFVNAGVNLSDDVQLYGFGSYMDNKTLSGFFYRRPVLPPQYGISARSTLMVDANGDFLPDNASQALVNSITGAGLNPADYLTASTGSPSGWVLLNPINTQFPGGYSPLFGANIKDYEFVGGVRGGESGNLKWDVHGRTASNEITYVLEQSINPSLGRLSPTTFRPGTLTQDETEFGVDFVQSFNDSPMTLAYGGLWRNETYKIGQGDAASIAVGPTAAQFGVGSDGFQGFFPGSAGSFKADSYSAYVDLETELSDKLSGAVALRYEKADSFNSALVYKVSARYAFTDTFALRGTYNTGFRVPTPGQQHTLNVTTTADSSGNLIPSGTYPVDNPVALALGAVPLDTEKSKSFTLGFAWDPYENVSVTLDYYEIRIKDRIGLISKTVTQSTVNALNAAGYPNAQLLLGSSANYFGNAFGSDVNGIDFVIDSRYQVGGGTLNVDFRHNYNKQNVVDVKPGTINAGSVYDLEHQIPNNRTTLTFDFDRGHFDGLVRFNRYGDWHTTGGLFGPGDASDAVGYSGKVLVDIEARYKFNDTFTLAVGGDNVFDTRPDKEKDPTLSFLGNEYAITSPFGFNGGLWYVRLTADF
jgi:iron complex outermembrane receptor protein